VNKAALKRWGIAGAVAGAAVAALCAYAAWEHKDLWLPQYLHWRDAAVAWLQQVNPALFFLLMATVPALPVPMSPFYLASGIFPTPVALLGICIAIPANIAITYWLVRTLMRPLALRLLKGAGREIPRASTKRGEIIFSVFVRVCGMPYTLQNYILALSHIPFGTYMAVGVPLQFAPAVAMMFLGDSLLKGEGRKALIALGILVALGILTKLTKDILQKRRAGRATITEDPRDAPL
jgi:uncharacterized membrane protein YdjX (TVP38/TMEM64 family)